MAEQTFAQDIGKFIKIVGIRRDKVIRKIALDALQGLLLRSPVDTGRFRGSWRLGINAVDPSVYPVIEQGESTGATHNSRASVGIEVQQVQKISKLKYGNTVHITNSLPYAISLEKGHSKQYPTGLLKDTFAEITLNLRFAVKEATKGT